jgi:DNA-binding cell septation regulator SpoVG
MKIINMRTGNWGKLTAFFDVATDEGFIIKGFKLVNGINGPFVGFPSQKGNDDEYYDTVWLTEEVRESVREKLNKMATEKYNNEQGSTPEPVVSVTEESNPKPSENNAPLEASKDDVATTEAPFSEDDLPF